MEGEVNSEMAYSFDLTSCVNTVQVEAISESEANVPQNAISNSWS